MKKILGLDLGTNSIGWALIEQDFDKTEGKILGMGSRIIPMSQDILGDFEKGNSVSQTATRTNLRGKRRLIEKNLLRRERLHRVLKVLGFLPAHYAEQIDFINRLGKFKNNSEPKLAYQNNQFLFKNSFLEMLEDFKIFQPDLVSDNKLVPYDWTIYYLRKKALKNKISKEEIAWIILNFNQKRGYYQLRGEEEEENPNKLVEFHSLKVIDVVADDKPNVKGDLWYSLTLENGWIYRRSSKTPLNDWKNKVRDFIVTTDLNDDGTIKKDKEGTEKRSFRAPGEDDWTLLKKKTESEIDKSEKTVGTFIYDTLLKNPNQKIKGRLVRTIERKFYKDELISILTKQIELQSELFTSDILNNCIKELYRSSDNQRQILLQKDFVYLFVNDIIFYQRPLRSQKSNIGRCSLEYHTFELTDKEGKKYEKKEYLKAIPKSHPLYQEFRLWQWISNLKIYANEDEKDVTANFISESSDIDALFDFLNNRKEIKQDILIKFFLERTGLKGKFLNNEVVKYRWNYVQEKEYPCNETGALIRSRLSKVENINVDFLTKEIEIQLWHIIYSVTDKIEFEKALRTFAQKHELDAESFVECFKKIKPFNSDYGSFSEKAVKKLLPLLRTGKYWDWNNIDKKSKKRIEKIITGECDEKIKDRVREKAFHLESPNHFQGLQLWLAQYIVYNRHSEAGNAEKWSSITELEEYITNFRQHSLRNPIVEQVVTETLRIVKDIWKKYGKGVVNFFDEIHVELGREMKNTADERKRLTGKVTENENTNLRIKSFLAELLNEGKVENVRPYSPSQQEALKIFEDGVLKSGLEIPDDILKISKSAQPSKSEFQRYKLWMEQKYKSPYTGKIIPLNKLFTSAYEIEHIIPQSRYFDDSFSNKVICEAAVNSLKDKKLGLEFIKSNPGRIVQTGFGETVKIFMEDEYKDFINQHYKENRTKRNKLLMEELPEKMIERQLNDTRFISKFISEVLSNIVRENVGDDGVNSKNILPGNGKITTQLKQDWGLNDVWNDLILPRFERMNMLTSGNAFTSWNENHHKFLPTIPMEYSKGFQKKRIDHRHHAMDALVIACATREHINLLNNQSAKSEKTRYDLQNILRNKEKYIDKTNTEKEKFVEFIKPWNSFPQDAKYELNKIVVSFKQNLRVINKTNNKYQKYVEKNGDLTKEFVSQSKGDSWAIRKPMHKDTVSGAISLRLKKSVSLNIAIDNHIDIVDKSLRKQIVKLKQAGNDNKKITKFFKEKDYLWNDIDISRVEIFYWDHENVASRVYLDTSFNEEKIQKSVTDSGIQKILLNHLKSYSGRIDEKGKVILPETLAFTPEGIEELNNNIVALNDGKFHQPIYKIRTYEPKGNKFAVGVTGNKSTKFVEAAKGTNLFFAIYQDESGKRTYETIPLNIVIERQKQGLSSVPEMNEKGHVLLFHLSPNDLVYVPTDEEIESITDYSFDKNKIENIFKIVSFTGTRLSVIPVNVASVIINKVEYTQLNKIELTKEKEICIKLKSDRLGNISKA